MSRMPRPISPVPLQAHDFPSDRTHRVSLLNMLFALIMLGIILFGQGCGGGGGSSAAAGPVAQTPAPETGELFIAITDAAGDFAKYEVDVLQLTLERANGDTVDTLPLSTRIDFTELTQATEFLSVATVPVGNYESASVRLDFSNADIWVQTDTEDAQAMAVDDAGNPLGELEVRLQLTTSDVIRIRRGIPAAFSLDFDLDASNDVDLEVSPPVVTVDPFLLATPELEMDREHRVRGALQAVDETASKFSLRVRPFRHRSGEFGELTVMVDDDTQYEVDGEGYTGESGLAALAELGEGSDANIPVISNGAISSAGLTASIVLAGSSVSWSDHNVVSGVVAAREGNLLTVRGAHVQRADAARDFRVGHTVLLGDGTTVTAPGVDNAMLSIQSISVGQRIVAWGEFSDDGMLDASQGRVRMQMNQLTAEVVQAAPLAVDLFHLNGRRQQAYDFRGTGIDPEHDADPDFYEIDTGVLDIAFAEGDLIRVRGLVSEFGAAPADYLARTTIDVATDNRAAHLQIGWSDGTTMPFVSIAPARIDVDLSEARKLLKLRGVPRGFLEDLATVALVAPDDDRGVYAVKVRGEGEMRAYRSFAGLLEELISQLDSGRILHRIGTTGRHNTVTHELTTGRASFVFTAPEVD